MSEPTEEIYEDLCNFATAIESAAVDLKQRIAKRRKAESSKTATSEERFLNLEYEKAKGDRLGDYEVAYKDPNKPEEWQHCFNMLKANNATIKNHFTEENWAYYYWQYEKNTDRFYRKQKTNQK